MSEPDDERELAWGAKAFLDGLPYDPGESASWRRGYEDAIAIEPLPAGEEPE
jgi:hypothetical protein